MSYSLSSADVLSELRAYGFTAEWLEVEQAVLVGHTDRAVTESEIRDALSSTRGLKFSESAGYVFIWKG